jgi:hypothetical protein
MIPRLEFPKRKAGYGFWVWTALGRSKSDGPAHCRCGQPPSYHSVTRHAHASNRREPGEPRITLPFAINATELGTHQNRPFVRYPTDSPKTAAVIMKACQSGLRPCSPNSLTLRPLRSVRSATDRSRIGRRSLVVPLAIANAGISSPVGGVAHSNIDIGRESSVPHPLACESRIRPCGRLTISSDGSTRNIWRCLV